MRIVNFKTNWNHKLNCDAFSSIRLSNKSKYIVGATYEIQLANKPIKEATLIGKRTIKLENVNDYVAYLDSGYPAEKFRQIVETMYKNMNDVDVRKRDFDFLLFKTIKNPSRLY